MAHRRADVGYWVLYRYRGPGYATAALRLLTEPGRQWGLVRLQAQVDTGDSASPAARRAAGFAPEGTLRAYQRIGDTQRAMVVLAHLP